MKSRIPAVAHKEFLHIIRDWRSLGMTLALPIMMVLLFGYAITFDIRDVKLVLYDADHSAESRALADAFTSSGHFKLIDLAPSDESLGGYLEDGRAQIAVSIPVDYGRRIKEGGEARVGVLVDGTEPNNASIASGYVEAILLTQRVTYGLEFVKRLGVSRTPAFPPIDPKPRFLYNSEMRSQNYIVPGLIGTIMMVITALLTSLTIVREKERGSLELLLATPVRAHEIMIGKLLPYFAVGMIDATLVAVIGCFAFDVPFAGSIWLFILASALFAGAGLGVGLFISVSATNQVVAMQMAILSTMLPSYLLSGFMFAIRNMPDWVQPVTYLVTARYYIILVRGLFLKGAGLAQLWPQFVFLIVFAALMLALCVKRFKKKIG